MTRLSSLAAQLQMFIKQHLLPLTVLTIAIIIGQKIVLSQSPLILPTVFPDSRDYLAASARMIHGFHIIDPYRTPGYPAFISIIFFLLRGEHYNAVLVAQVLLTIFASYEIYLIVWNQIMNKWLASLIASILSLNLYQLDWERAILTETLSFWLIVTLFLCTGYLIRKGNYLISLTFALISILLILTRPFMIFLPIVILIALLARSLFIKNGRHQTRRIFTIFLIIYGVIGCYMFSNLLLNGYLGITYVGNVNLLGKVIEYQMYTLPTEPKYQSLQQNVITYTSNGNWEPWTFTKQYQYSAHFYSDVGGYSHSVIEHNILLYSYKTLNDIVRVWNSPPIAYIPFFETGKISSLIHMSQRMYLLYNLFPIIVFFLLHRLWRKRDDTSFFILILALGVIGEIVMSAVGSYAEFYRLRFPLDWGMVVVCIVGLWLFVQDIVQLNKQVKDKNVDDDDTGLATTKLRIPVVR